MKKSTGNNKPVKAFQKTSSAGSAKKIISHSRPIAAPSKPANASMSTMGKKLTRGDYRC